MPSPPADTDGLPIPQRYWAMLTIAMTLTMAVLDGAIANVALPTIAHDLDASPVASVWVVNAYQLAITISLLPLAALGEIVEYRRVYQAGLVIFTVASLGCALSDSLTTLTVARTLQGFGAAGIMSVNTALVRFIYPQKALGRGLGINAMTVSVSSAIGPSVAAAILAVAPWPWLFAVNVPTGLIALAAAGSLPATRRGQHRFDWLGATLSALAFGFLITGIGSAGQGGGIAAIGEIVVGAAALVLLFLNQRRQTWPLLPVDLLRIPMFALSISTSVCSFAGQMLAYVSLPFYLEDVLGRSQVETGLLMTPWPLASAVIAPIAGRLADRIAIGLLGGIGLASFAAGLLLLAYLPASPTGADIAWRMAVCGFGFGLFQTPNNRAIVGSAPRHRAGGASGMLGTARLVGQSVGTALVAFVFSLSLTRGTTNALLLGAAMAIAGAVVSSLRIAQPPPPG